MSKSQASWWDYLPESVDVGELVHSTAEQAAATLREAVGEVADAGNSAVQDALDLGNQAVEAGKAGALGLQETGGDLFDAIADAIVQDEQSSGEAQEGVGTPETTEDPAVDEVEQAIEQQDETYLDQRDNQSKHVDGDYSCSPTSFAAALIDSVGDEAAVRDRAVELIEERGGDTSYEQTEELIIELLEAVDWPSVCKSSPEFFWNGSKWAAWAEAQYGGTYYKDPYAQQYVASLFTGMSSEPGKIYGSIFGYDAWKPVVEALDAGAEVTAEGGAMTDSGHVIRILEADATGLLVNDPYGLWVHKDLYLKNNADYVPDVGGDADVFSRRVSRNAELQAQYDAVLEEGPDWTPYGRWGEHNWFSWADAEQAQLGKWVSVLKKA